MADALLSTVLGKTLHEQRRAGLGWSVALVGLTVMLMAFFPSIQESAAEFEALIDQYPPAMKAFVGDLAGIGTPAGYLKAELFGSMLPILLLVYAIGRGAGSIAGEEDRGTMDVLMALPVTRRRVVLDKLAALLAGVAALSAVVYATVLAGGLVGPLDVAAGALLAAVASLALLVALFGTIALAVGAATGRRGLAIGVAGGLAALTFILFGLSRLVDALEPAQWALPWTFYDGGAALTDGMDPLGGAAMILALAAFAGLALWGFDRRDVRR